MTRLNVVYRQEFPGTQDEQWFSYSFPTGVYVSGKTLDETRSEFRDAAATVVAEFEPKDVSEHLERPVPTSPDAYVRVSLDRWTRDREAVADQFATAMGLPRQADDFNKNSVITAGGDAVMIACLPHDRLQFIFEQVTDEDGVGICALGPSSPAGRFVWWSFLVGLKAQYTGAKPTETLGQAGLNEDSTISEFMLTNSESHGRRLVAAAS